MFGIKKIIILGFLLAAGSYWYLSNNKNENGTIEYRTELPQLMDLERTVSSLGKIKPKEEVQVGAQVSGQLEKLHAEVGGLVTKGDLLAEIDPTLLQARVDAGQASLKELRASYAQQVAQIKLSKARAERNRKLYKDDAVSESDVEATDAELEIAEARLMQLEAQIERNTSTLEGDIANLNFTRVFAPMSGTVIEEVAEEGRTLNANQTTPTILRIADLDLMIIEADVSESDVSLLEPGMPVRFTTLGLPDRQWNTKVRQVLPQPEVLNDVVLYKALMDIRNDDGALLPEMTAQVFFIVGSARNALTIPAGAITEIDTVRRNAPAMITDERREEIRQRMAERGGVPGQGGGIGGGMGFSEEQIAAFRERMGEGMGGGFNGRGNDNTQMPGNDNNTVR
jgi:macrolide-specific efflux system membrane fusion protein